MYAEPQTAQEAIHRAATVRARLMGHKPHWLIEPRRRLPEPEPEPVQAPDPTPEPEPAPPVIQPWQNILIEVAEKHDIKVSAIVGELRFAKIVAARHEAVFRMVTELGMGFAAVGRRINRCHTTVLHSYRRTLEEMQKGEAAGDTMTEKPSLAEQIGHLTEVIDATKAQLDALPTKALSERLSALQASRDALNWLMNNYAECVAFIEAKKAEKGLFE